MTKWILLNIRLIGIAHLYVHLCESLESTFVCRIDCRINAEATVNQVS